MDTQHRHDLEQNDLQYFLTHLGPFWDKYGMTILLVILTIVAIFSGRTFYGRYVDQSHQSAVRDLEMATSPESYRGVAQQSSEPPVAALALLRGADLALASAVLPQPADAAPPTTQPGLTAPGPKGPQTPAERQAALKDAEQMYKGVLDHPAASPVLRLNAKLGMAAVAESRSDWESAGKLYRETIEQATDYDVIRQRAQKRQALLEQLKKPVAFAPEPATQPASQLPSFNFGESKTHLPAALPTDGDTAPGAEPAAPAATAPASPAKPAAVKPAAAKPAPAKPAAKPANAGATTQPAKPAPTR